jgi:hypothetical protein
VIVNHSIEITSQVDYLTLFGDVLHVIANQSIDITSQIDYLTLFSDVLHVIANQSIDKHLISIAQVSHT